MASLDHLNHIFFLVLMTTKTNITFSINRLFFDSKAKESYYCPAKFIIAKPKS